MLTSAIASPIWTNLSTKPMTVSKLLDDVVVNTMSITAPVASTPDGVDSSEDPAASCTKDSSLAWSGLVQASLPTVNRSDLKSPQGLQLHLIH